MLRRICHPSVVFQYGLRCICTLHPTLNALDLLRYYGVPSRPRAAASVAAMKIDAPVAFDIVLVGAVPTAARVLLTTIVRHHFKQLSCQHPFALSIYTVTCIFTVHTRREHSPRHHRNGNTACYWMRKTVLTPALWRQRGAGEVALRPCCRQGRRNRSKIHRNEIYPKQNLLGTVSLLPDHGALATLQLLLIKQRFLLTSCSRLRHSLQRAAQGLS